MQKWVKLDQSEESCGVSFGFYIYVCVCICKIYINPSLYHAVFAF